MTGFEDLGPDLMMTAVEEALVVKLTGLAAPFQEGVQRARCRIAQLEDFADPPAAGLQRGPTGEGLRRRVHAADPALVVGADHRLAHAFEGDIEVVGEPGYLTEPMDHISYRTKEDYWRKADTYTTLTAREMKEKHRPVTWWSYNITKPIYTFLSLFLRHKGFMDGWYGFVFAYWSALHFPIAYKKYKKL